MYARAVAVVAAMFFVGALSATTIVLPTDAQLVAKAELIVQGTVVRSTPIVDGSAVWTESVIAVEAMHKGAPVEQVVVRELGGVAGNRFTKIFGAPRYTPGERVLAFLVATPRGDFQTVDLVVGKYTEARTRQGRRSWRRDLGAHEVTLVDESFEPVRSDAARDAAAFEAFVDDRVHGREGVANYGLVAPDTARIASNFVTIDEPAVDRWFAFDEGKSVAWHSFGAQRGYAGGGANEIALAMAPWNGSPQTKIRYQYAGPTNVAGSMRWQDGVNQISFEDPAEEIAGSFGSSGGVVAIGGIHGSASIARSWTAPFAADDAHPAGPRDAREIVEAFLTIQDGVSPENGISSSRLATIIAHELGHTLGIGHSPDPTALMYALVTMTEPSLTPDDERAARWLYPDAPAVISVPLAASFEVSSPTGAAGVTTFAFSDHSTGSPLTRTWRFGDGRTSTVVSPTHVYTVTGTYVVTLTLTDGDAYSVASHVVTVVRPKAKRRASGR